MGQEPEALKQLVWHLSGRVKAEAAPLREGKATTFLLIHGSRQPGWKDGKRSCGKLYTVYRTFEHFAGGESENVGFGTPLLR